MPDDTLCLTDSDADIDRAAGILRAGGLVAFPTETVYGLGADAGNDRAVARVFEAKGRPHFNPLIAHLPDTATAETLVIFDADARALADAFWPGALTLVLPVRPGARLSRLVTAGLETLAVRVPAHPVAHRLLAAVGGPVAAPSANPSGRISPTDAAHVLAGLRGRIDAVVDGGPCTVGVESTIVALTDRPRLLRPGGVAAEIIEKVLGRSLALPDAAAGIAAPGMLASHYAPDAPVRLNARSRQRGETLLGFGCIGGDLNLSPTGDLVEAAANLYGFLHRLDSKGTRAIAVAPIPETGLGRAINDRLRRAAAPRPQG